MGASGLFTRYLVRIAISFLLLLLFLLYVGKILPVPMLDELERLSYDARVRVTMPNKPSDEVVIVDLDEKSMAAEGQWPWPRDKLATMVDELFEHYHVRALGFDIVFPEADRTGDLGLLQRLADGPLDGNQQFLDTFARIKPDLEHDRIFAASMQGRPVVLGYTFAESAADVGGASKGQLPAPVIPETANDTRLDFIKAQGYVANLPVLQTAAAHGGFFSNPTVDPDGSFRRVTMLEQYQKDIYENLDLSVLRAALGWPPIKFRFATESPAERTNLNLDWITVGKYRIPVDADMAALVPFRGGAFTFPYISATDVIHGTAPVEKLADKIVLVGTTAAGLHDLRATPTGELFPGVEVHANVIAGILDQRVKSHPPYVSGIHVAMLLLLAFLLTWVFTSNAVVTATLTTVGTLIVLIGGNLALWEYGDFVVPLASPVVFVLVLFGLHVTYGFFVESRGKRHLSRLFGQYIPPEIVEEMDRDQEEVSLEGESREMTVLFSDVRGFTSISEGLEPKALSALMNAYLTPMTRTIHTRRGTIDKYIGDAIMAFWGAPLHDREHARHALEAALEMLAVLKRDLRPEFKRKGWPELHIGVGLNTGIMNVGNMGSEFRMAYTVMGDAVNLGSRLEGLTKQYGVEIIVSDSTKAAVPDHAFLELDRVRVKGKDEPVAIYEPLGPREGVDKDLKSLLGRHKQALRLYRNREWDSAEREFFTLHQAQPDRLVYQIYLDRIAHFRAHPPGADWDGVFVHETK